jgi:hypothetical protein
MSEFSNPKLASIVGWVEGQNPTFFVQWVGLLAVLGYANTFFYPTTTRGAKTVPIALRAGQ